MQKRIFISVPVSESIKTKIFRLQKKFISFAGVKWEPRKKLHVTLHFLGYLTEGEIDKVKKILSLIKAKTFKADMAEYSFFPSKNHARVAVLKIFSHNKLENVQSEIENGLKKHKFFKSEKRKYTAHLTIGRIKEITDQQIDLIEKEKIKGYWQVKEIYLMQSILKRTGSEYKVLSKYKLWKK